MLSIRIGPRQQKARALCLVCGDDFRLRRVTVSLTIDGQDDRYVCLHCTPKPLRREAKQLRRELRAAAEAVR